MEYMQASIIVESTDEDWDGKIKDSIEDYDHRASAKGFQMSDEISYHNKMLFETYNNEWYQISDTYAERLSIVCDIVVITPEYKDGYMKSVYSTVIIPIIENN